VVWFKEADPDQLTGHHGIWSGGPWGSGEYALYRLESRHPEGRPAQLLPVLQLAAQESEKYTSVGLAAIACT
jgi:hypothetical protein